MGFLIDTCVWIDVEQGKLAPGDVAATTGDVFGGVAAQIKSGGRGHRYRVQDLWLASQAIQHGYRLLTRNKHDFEDIPGLDLVLI
ncbi:MAG: PIN domain-containing protein [Burkholderiales bacterium]